MSHQRSESYSKIQIDTQENLREVEVEYSVQISVLQRFDFDFSRGWEEELINEVTENFQFNEICESYQTPFLKNSFSTGYLSLLWKMQCDLEEIEIDFKLFFEKDPTHTHIATFLIDSQAIPEKVFTNSARNWKETDTAEEDSSNFDSFFDYFNLGFRHILSGFDHLAFLLALLILKLSLKKLILTITGFTIGHSITLALGALGLLTPSSQLVEALIGYSIIIISIECVAKITNNQYLYSRYLIYFSSALILVFALLGYQKFIIGLIGISIFSYCYLALTALYKDFSITLLVTSLFGLIHGFGFAGNLSSIGLMEGRILPAILGFNLGVELGQILVVIVLSILFYQLTNFLKNYTDTMRVYMASGLSCLGMFWFIERLI